MRACYSRPPASRNALMLAGLGSMTQASPALIRAQRARIDKSGDDAALELPIRIDAASAGV